MEPGALSCAEFGREGRDHAEWKVGVDWGRS